MPLSRYQIRNEYSLADPELYKAADKDDPEALLEGVAMAGLVGVLRQLGDLAEFAAEVFHDLHEEVMATAARGNSLIVRVQQLEIEFPLIEKAFLSQSNHSAFFYNSGIEWHPNMSIDQNHITRGDLPRFLMDTYEESRGPPRLFLLDKFDIAGAGACLKRYTDPSFYKVEAATLGITNTDVKREKKVRKGKQRRGSRRRNGETPEVLPTPHAKLHQLLLEERIENTSSDPARRVKLKRRLNGFPFNVKTGKSYMEKILTPSSDHKVLQEVSICSSPLTQRCPSPTLDMKDGVPKVSRDELDILTSNTKNYDVLKAGYSLEPDNDSSPLHDDVGEKEIMVDRESITEDSMDGYQSDDVASGVENYVDALATMEPEVDIDPELRAKSDLNVLSNRKRVSGLDATKSIRLAHFSESQSMGSSTLSDDENSLSKKCTSRSSDSDSPSVLVEGAHLEGEISNKVYPSTEICETNSGSKPLKWRGRVNNAGGSEVAEIFTYSSDHCEQTLSNVTVYSGILTHKNADAALDGLGNLQVNTGGVLCAQDEPITGSTNAIESGINLDTNVNHGPDASAAPLQRENDPLSGIFAENVVLDRVDNEHYSMMDSVSSSLPNFSDDACFAEGFEDQHMEQSLAENLNLLDDVAPASCLLERGHYNIEENLSPSSPKSQPLIESGNGESNLVEHPSKQLLKDPSVDGLDTDLPTDISTTGNMDPNVMYGSVNLSSCIAVTLEEEMGETLPDNMAQTGDEDHLKAHPIVNNTNSPITSEPPSEEQGPPPRLPALETNAREGETEYTDGKSNNPISPSAEVVVGPTSRMGVPGNLHSEDLHISVVKDFSLPPDPADDPTDHQSNCSSPVIIERQSSELSWADTNAQALSGSSRSGDIKEIQVPATLDNVPQFVGISYNGDKDFHELPSVDDREEMDVAPARESALDMRPLSGSLEDHDLKEMRASVTVDGMAQLGVAEIRTSYNGDEKLQELPSLPGVENMDTLPLRETAPDTKVLIGSREGHDSKEMPASATTVDIAQLDSADVGTSSNSLENLHELQRLGGENTDAVNSSTRLAVRGDNDFESFTGIVNLSDPDAEGDGIESSQYGIDAEVPVSLSYCELDMVKKESVQNVTSQSSDLVLREPLYFDHTESEVLDNFSSSQSESKSSLHSEIAASLSMEQSEFGTNRVHSEKSTKTDSTEDTLPTPIHHNVETQEVNLPRHQPGEEETGVLRETSEENLVPEPQLKQKGNSDLLDLEDYPGSAISFLENLPSPPLASEMLPEENATPIDVPPNEPLESISPSFGLLPEAVNIDLQRMPPLPPLPPVQWRMGKNQPASLPHEKEALPNSVGFFPLISLSEADQKAQTPELSLVHHAVSAEDSPRVSKSTPGNIFHDGPFALQVPLIENDQSNTNSPLVCKTQSLNQNLPVAGDNSILPSLCELQSAKHLSLPSLGEPHSRDQVLPLPENISNLSSLGEIQSVNPNLPLPAKVYEMVQHDDSTGPSSNSFIQGTGVDTAATGDVGRIHDSATPIQQHETPETSPKDKLLDQGFPCSEGNLTIHDGNALPPKKENERPQNMMLSLEGEIIWPAQDEIKANGVRTTKLPRPRNPLIDAVVAHDKSKLKKVTERPRPQIQKPDERDSLLEQIRAKSFNLKPTVVSKPSIQGPSTNLKVAAILEKAKTIRQAFAGSDEEDDDDGDSWSDS